MLQHCIYDAIILTQIYTSLQYSSVHCHFNLLAAWCNSTEQSTHYLIDPRHNYSASLHFFTFCSHRCITHQQQEQQQQLITTTTAVAAVKTKTTIVGYYCCYTVVKLFRILLFLSEYNLRKIITQFHAINQFPPGIQYIQVLDILYMPKGHKKIIDEIFLYVLVLGYWSCAECPRFECTGCLEGMDL